MRPPLNPYGQPGSPLQALAQAAAHAHATARREYARGWRWGVVCGLTCGVCTTGTAVWLWGLIEAALRCPAC